MEGRPLHDGHRHHAADQHHAPGADHSGSLVVMGAVLATLVSPWFILLSGFVGAGLVFAGVTDTCMMAILLSKLPYNRPQPTVTTHQTA